jgi:hypothetical protein
LPVIPTGVNSGGTNHGLDGNDIYDDGPLVSDDDGTSMVVNPSSSSTTSRSEVIRPLRPDVLSKDNVDVKGTDIVRYPSDLDIDKSENFNNQYNRWLQQSTYWSYGKTTEDVSLPRITARSKTGPQTSDLDGVRWILAHFNDGSRLIVKDMFMSGKDGRADRHKDAYVKLSTVPWRGMLLYITRTSKYIDDIPIDGDLIEWKDTTALDAAGAAVDVAYAAAVSALLE